jgi:hypothetical protein
MKRTFTLLFSFLLLASAGYALQNRLTISSNNNSGIRVLIDGRTYQLDKNRNNGEITLTDLRPGSRNIRIYAQKNNGRTWPGNINTDRNMQMIYNSNLYIRDGVDVDVSINRFGKVFVDEQNLSRGYENDDRYGSRDDNRYDDRDWNRNMRAMSDLSFLQLKQNLDRERFEDTKLNMINTAISNNNYVSSQQVKELLGQFSFEANKLTVAKYCYQFVTDRQNYYSVADALNHSTSKNELMRYIQQQK